MGFRKKNETEREELEALIERLEDTVAEVKNAIFALSQENAKAARISSDLVKAANKAEGAAKLAFRSLHQ